MKVGIVEDQAFYRNYLKDLVEKEFGFEVVVSCGDGIEATQLCITHGVELLILDLMIQSLHGLEVAKILMDQRPILKVLTFSGEVNPYNIKVVDSLGILGYLDKSDEVMEDEAFLVSAIHEVAKGRRVFSPKISQLREQMAKDDFAFHKILSPKKIEILKRVGKCMTDEEISEDLGISGHTVRKHRAEIMQYLELDSTHALIRYAQRVGISMGG
jgi:DNA-binding NarL/FixJ family response regulator